MYSLLSVDMLPLSPLAAILPIAGIALVFFVGFRRMKKGAVPSRSTFVWAGLQVLLLVFIAVFCMLGLCKLEFWMYLIASVAITLCGIGTLYREGALKKLMTSKKKEVSSHVVSKAMIQNPSYVKNTIRVVILLFLIAFAAMIAMEIADNPKTFMIWPGLFFTEYAMVGLVIVALYFLGQRHGAAPAVGVLAFAFIGIAEAFVDRFKRAAITPADLFALDTAAEVSDSYEFALSTAMLITITVAAVGLLLCAYIAPTGRKLTPGKRSVQVAINILAGVACIVGLCFVVGTPRYAKVFSMDLAYWDLRVAYRTNGFLPGFIATAQELETKMPENYSDERAEEIEQRLASRYDELSGQLETVAAARSQFDELKPCVITVMNESYSDLSILDELHAGYTGPSYTTTNPEDAIGKGPLFVSVFGGGTCNSEFEYLTGNSLGLIGASKYPYVQYNLQDIDSLPKQFSSLGYKTVAIHPESPTNWHRDKVFSQFGFDEFFSIDDFEGADQYHGAASDGATYDKIIELLKSDSAPQFIMDITMQNHGGYATGNIPAADKLDYKPDVGTAEDTAQLNEYLSCIEASDRDLEKFIEELRTIDRPVVLVFFGDHQPSISALYNSEFNDRSNLMVYYSHIAQTRYIIWSNYPIAGLEESFSRLNLPSVEPKGGRTYFDCTEGQIFLDPVDNYGSYENLGELELAGEGTINRMMSLNYLPAYTLETIGAPLTSFQKASMMFMQDIPIINTNGYTDTNAVWFGFEDKKAKLYDTYQDFATVQYHHFNRNVS